MKIERVIISGGGTGGHIFPAIAIADEIKNRNPEVKILFVGATGKMEMEKVPEAGYAIEGLPIRGFQRRLTFQNFVLPFKLIYSFFRALTITHRFKPQAVIGVGGYASAPTLYAASFSHIPVLIQEQNGFPGKTNKSMAKRATKICVAYEGLEKFFSKEKIALTGNPIRLNMVQIEGKREEALRTFGLSSERKTILVVGGSLGARTLNESVKNAITRLGETNVQVLWQSGKNNYQEMKDYLTAHPADNIHLLQFIQRMDLAYAAADLIISRAGAIAISELCIIGKPIILVPSPNVAEDHQTKNAMALVKNNAALMVKDTEARTKLIDSALDLLKNQKRQVEMCTHLSMMARPNATAAIVDEIEKIIR